MGGPTKTFIERGILGTCMHDNYDLGPVRTLENIIWDRYRHDTYFEDVLGNHAQL